MRDFIFVTRSVPGSPMLLWVGNEKHELDMGVVLELHRETGEYIAEQVREKINEKD